MTRVELENLISSKEIVNMQFYIDDKFEVEVLTIYAKKIDSSYVSLRIKDLESDSIGKIKINDNNEFCHIKIRDIQDNFILADLEKKIEN